MVQLRDRVLVVDDDGCIRELLAELLRREGYQVTEAGNGQAALDHIAAHGAPDLIVLDLNMPVLDGWGVLAALQRHPRLRTVPVLVTTADRHRPTLADGASQVLPKPMDVDELLGAIASLLDSKYVLIVEDDAAIREAVIDALAVEGYRAIAVCDGREALDHLRARARPLAIVTDLEMPTMHGWDLLQALQGSPPLSTIPVVIMTGNIPPGHLESHWRVLRKPFSPMALAAELQALREINERRAATPAAG